MKRISRILLGVVASTAMGAEITEEVVYPGSARFVTAGASVLVGENTGNPGFVAGISGRLSPHLPVYGGAELGTYFLSLKSGGMALTILPTATYEWDEGYGWTAYLGLMTGPLVAFNQGDSSWRWATFLRPGVRMPLVAGMDFNVETRIGFIGQDFYFAPQFGAAFRI